MAKHDNAGTTPHRIVDAPEARCKLGGHYPHMDSRDRLHVIDAGWES
jgi:hypothetical protein